MKTNAEWHLANKMPKNPTLDQRVNWHLGHAKIVPVGRWVEKSWNRLKSED